MINTSSMVSELAPVVLFLRECVTIGDLLIIEEPEAHLHPALQVQFTRILAKLVKIGVRVLITTHSEWITEELSNIVFRSTSHSKENHQDKLTTIALDADSVGMWLFNPKMIDGRQTGATVSEIELDDSGLFPTGYDDVATKLHNDWAESAVSHA